MANPITPTPRETTPSGIRMEVGWLEVLGIADQTMEGYMLTPLQIVPMSQVTHGNTMTLGVIGKMLTVDSVFGANVHWLKIILNCSYKVGQIYNKNYLIPISWLETRGKLLLESWGATFLPD